MRLSALTTQREMFFLTLVGRKMFMLPVCLDQLDNVRVKCLLDNIGK